MSGVVPMTAGRREAGARDRDIAIVGMACVFPGAGDLKAYWENILAGVDAVGDPPPDWGAEAALDPSAKTNDRLYCARGGYLGPLAAFDPTRYGVMPNSVDGGEPDHFLALRAAVDALADAGGLERARVARDRAEVVIGRGTYVNRGNTTVIQHTVVVDQVLRILKQLHPEHDDAELAAIKRELKASLPPFHAETAAALVPNIITGRIANRLDLMGANYLVDAACASSLVAVDLGVRDLLAGRCDLALVGGVHASTPPPIVTIFCQINAISPKGRIRPFDAGADGTLLGEGAGMVVLRRLADAERDGDRIYAVLKGIGVASDGKALGLLAPRVEGEELALRRAYETAGVPPGTVGLVEAHGTATPVGDVTEIDALRRVFGERRDGDPPRCALGSVKSMISHLMPASGIAGLIKVALALHHKVLPPTINVDRPNPKLGLERTTFYLNTRTRPWIHGSPDAPRRAGVNAFGFGGINAHAVLEEYDGPVERRAPGLQHRWDSEVFVLSGASRDEVIAQAARVRAFLAREPEASLKDLAWTLNGGPAGPVRLAVVAGTRDELDARLERAVTRLGDPRTRRIRDIEGIYYFDTPLGEGGRVAFVFPGEGAQYEDMLSDLAVHFPEVRAEFDYLDRVFRSAGRDSVPSEAIFPPPQPGIERGEADRQRLYRMDLGAEAVFAANQALVALMRHLGVRPDAMVGHSTGEHSALLAAGIVDARDEAELAAHILGVNAVYQELETRGDIPGGLLVATGGVAREPLDAILAAAGGTVHVALDNCPHQIVLCGQTEGIEAVVGELQARHAICQRLPFARAYHTPWFEVFCAPLRAHFDRVRIQPGTTPVYSCVTAERFPDGPDAIRELASRQWARTVRFRETVEAMHRDGVRVFVEVGPRGNLTAFIDDILRGRPYTAVAANVAHRSGLTQLNHLVGQLVAHHVPVRLEALYERRAPARLDLDGTAARPARAGRLVKLATGLQPLSLGPSFQVPRPAVEAPRPAAAARVQAPDAGVPAAPGAGPRLVAHSGPAAAPVSSAARAERAALMQQHTETMSQFLAAQQQVMTAYLGRRTRPAAPAVPEPGPLVDEVVSLEPGRRAVALHHLDAARDRFLDDHTLGRGISHDDPALRALAVVPLTMTLELVAEAAALVAPGLALTGLREFRAHRWITAEAPRVLELTAEAAGPREVKVVLRARGLEGAAAQALAESVVEFAAAAPAPPAAEGFALAGERASRWTAEALYRDGMFHGPAFRAVRSMDRAGEDGASATLEVLPAAGLLDGRAAPAFLTDPVLLDAAGQVLAFWVKERLGVEVDVFPYRVGAVRVFGPPPAPGTPVTCRVRGEIDGAMRTRCDIDLVDAGGRVLYRLESWEDRQFRLPAGLLALRTSPRDAFVGAAWRPALAGAPETELQGTRITGLDVAALESHQGIWLKMLAGIVLGRRERALWDELAAAAPKRRVDWLLGRVAAKEAVRRLVERRTGERLLSADVEILPDGVGRPVVFGAWQARLALEPAVSLSHSDGVVVAIAASDRRALVGVDVERLTVDVDAVAAAAFTPDERTWLATLDESHRREWVVRLWCAKEAAGKALGHGFAKGLSALQLTRAELETGAVRLEARGERPEGTNGRHGREFVTQTARDGEYVSSAILQPAEESKE